MNESYNEKEDEIDFIKEFISNNLKAYSFIEKITSHPLKFSIFILLYIYHELNVSEISKKLNKSKATVSRHLIELEKNKILVSRLENSIGKINPKYYSLPREVLYLIKSSTRASLDNEKNYFNSLTIKNKVLANFDKVLKHEELKFEFYKSIFLKIKLFAILIKNGIKILEPYLNVLESKLSNLNDSERVFINLLKMQNLKLNFDVILIDEELIEEIRKLYREFLIKIYSIIDKNIQIKNGKKNSSKSILFLNAFIPLKEIIEFKI